MVAKNYESCYSVTQEMRWVIWSFSGRRSRTRSRRALRAQRRTAAHGACRCWHMRCARSGASTCRRRRSCPAASRISRRARSCTFPSAIRARRRSWPCRLRRWARMWSRCARCIRRWRGGSRRRTAAICSRSSSGRCARAGSSSRARATCARSRSGVQTGCSSRRRRGRSAACMTAFPAVWPPCARLPSGRRSGCGSCRRARFALEICARLLYNQTTAFAGVMELVDVLDSKSSAARRAGSSPATGTITSEEASIVPFPPRSENCTMLASSTYDGYSVSFGEGYEFHGWITYTWVIPIKGRPTKGR